MANRTIPSAATAAAMTATVHANETRTMGLELEVDEAVFPETHGEYGEKHESEGAHADGLSKLTHFRCVCRIIFFDPLDQDHDDGECKQYQERLRIGSGDRRRYAGVPMMSLNSAIEPARNSTHPNITKKSVKAHPPTLRAARGTQPR